MRKFFVAILFSILFASFVVGVAALYYSYFPNYEESRSANPRIREIEEKLVRRDYAVRLREAQIELQKQKLDEQRERLEEVRLEYDALRSKVAPLERSSEEAEKEKLALEEAERRRRIEDPSRRQRAEVAMVPDDQLRREEMARSEEARRQQMEERLREARIATVQSYDATVSRPSPTPTPMSNPTPASRPTSLPSVSVSKGGVSVGGVATAASGGSGSGGGANTKALSPQPSILAQASASVSPVEPADAACRAKMRKLGVVNFGSVPCVDIGDIVKNLTSGTYIFNKPDAAYVGVPFRIALALRTSPEQDVGPVLAGLPGAVAERSGRFSQSVEASLRGDEMTVKPDGAQVRTATTIEPVSWEWMITPDAGGKKTLVIEVAANILIGPDRHRVQISTLREPIEVSVSHFQRVKAYVADANGFVIAAGAAIPAIGALAGIVPSIRRAITRFWRWLTKRRRRTQHQAS